MDLFFEKVPKSTIIDVLIDSKGIFHIITTRGHCTLHFGSTIHFRWDTPENSFEEWPLNADLQKFLQAEAFQCLDWNKCVRLTASTPLWPARLRKSRWARTQSDLSRRVHPCIARIRRAKFWHLPRCPSFWPTAKHCGRTCAAPPRPSVFPSRPSQKKLNYLKSRWTTWELCWMIHDWQPMICSFWWILLGVLKSPTPFQDVCHCPSDRRLCRFGLPCKLPRLKKHRAIGSLPTWCVVLVLRDGLCLQIPTSFKRI